MCVFVCVFNSVSVYLKKASQPQSAYSVEWNSRVYLITLN